MLYSLRWLIAEYISKSYTYVIRWIELLVPLEPLYFFENTEIEELIIGGQ